MWRRVESVDWRVCWENFIFAESSIKMRKTWAAYHCKEHEKEAWNINIKLEIVRKLKTIERERERLKKIYSWKKSVLMLCVLFNSDSSLLPHLTSFIAHLSQVIVKPGPAGHSHFSSSLRGHAHSAPLGYHLFDFYLTSQRSFPLNLWLSNLRSLGAKQVDQAHQENEEIIWKLTAARWEI